MNVQNMNDRGTGSRKIDLKKLLELSTAAHEAIQVLKGKEVTLVVGQTGSGKGTLVNYLLKNKLIKIEDETDEVVIELDRITTTGTVGTTCNNEQVAAISHEFLSETLYPEAFETERGLLLCDTAGFGGNRSPEHNAAAYLAIQMIIQSAALVKGIIVVISANNFRDRATVLKETSSLLKQLIMGNENCTRNFENSVIFVFTHADYAGGKVRTEKWIRKLLERTQASLEQQVNDNPGDEDLADSLALCRIMLSPGIQTVIFDPLFEEHEGQFSDNPIARDNILNFIVQSNGIAKEDIAFRVERNFQRYSDTFFEIANSFLRSQKEIFHAQNRIKQYEKRIEDKKSEISKLLEVNSDLEQHCHENLRDEQKKIKDEISSLIGQIDNKKEKCKKVKMAKVKLENDITHVLVHTEVYSEKAVYAKIKGVTHCRTFDYFQSFPIAKVDYVGGNYSFTEGTSQEFSAPSYYDGRKRVTLKYTGPSHEDGRAEFRVYSEKKYTPDSKSQIECYEDELEDLEIEKKELQSDLEKAKEKESNLSRLIVEAEFQSTRDTESLIESNKKRIEAYNKELKDFSKVIEETSRKLELSKNTLTERKSEYEMLTQFSEIVPFDELTVKTFLFEYTKWDESFQPPRANISGVTVATPAVAHEI